MTSYRETTEITAAQGTTRSTSEVVKDADGTFSTHRVDEIEGLGTIETITIGTDTWTKNGDAPWEKQEGIAMGQQNTASLVKGSSQSLKSATYDGEDATGHKFTVSVVLGGQEMTFPVWTDAEMRVVRTEVTTSMGEQELTMVFARSDFDDADITVEPPM